MYKKVFLILLISFGLALGYKKYKESILPDFSDSQITVKASETSNALIMNLDIKLKEAGSVYVTFSSPEAGSFKQNAGSVFAHEHKLSLVRLRPLTKYDYQVHVNTQSGKLFTTPKRSFTTKDLPSDVKQLKINLVKGQLTSELLMLSQSETPVSGGLICVDSDGFIVWYNNRVSGGGPFQVLKSGNFIFMTSGLAVNQFGELTNTQIITPDLKPEQKILPVFEIDKSKIGIKNSIIGQLYMHHDFVVNQDGKIIYLSKMIKDPFFDVGLAKAGQRLQAGDTIRQFDPITKQDTLLFSIFDFLSPILDRGCDSNDTHKIPLNHNFLGFLSGRLSLEDWTHCNALSRFDDKSDYLLSVRKLNKILAIKPDFKSLSFVLGGLNGDFSFPDSRDRFYHQHDVHYLENGNILMFDNGNCRPASEGGLYSRALELKLDFEKKVVTKVWEYRHTPDIYCDRVGSVRRLKNGHTIVNFGGDQASDTFTILDIEPNGKIFGELHVSVTKQQASGVHALYRAIPMESIAGELKSAD